MKEKIRSYRSVIVMFVIALVLFCFYRMGAANDYKYTTNFNECTDVVVVESEFLEYTHGKYGRPNVICRYVVRNDSDEDKTIRFMGIYTDDLYYKEIKEPVLPSDRVYVVPAGSTQELVVTYTPLSLQTGSRMDHAPEAHILEA